MRSTRRRRVNAVFLLLTVFLLSACTTHTRPPYVISAASYAPVEDPAQTYVYECQNGQGFTIRIQQDRARLILPDRIVSLPRVSTDADMKFSDGSVTFQVVGEEALLVLGDKIYHGCRKNQAKAILADSRWRGVDFRAVGNEPGWTLEIDKEGRTVFIHDYGKERYVFATPHPVIDRESGTEIYLVQDAEHRMTIILRDQACYDDMSGEPFDTAVTLILDGRRLRGCGKSLR